ncbi:MAG: RHS repeat protein [Chitinophagaceae bacterium]|nr:RHS repeat protein [Chitinophagaceae bacterium]
MTINAHQKNKEQYLVRRILKNVIEKTGTQILLVLLSFLTLNKTGHTQKLSEVMPPSPQVTNFQKFGDYPVSYNTGIPDISIPLYTIKSGELEMPIILRYHSSGIKPKTDDLSNIASGWVLDVGGLISRAVKGKADEQYARPINFMEAAQVDQNNYDHVLYLENLMLQGPYDAEYDKFAYSFLDKNGSFLINEEGDGNYVAHPYPYVPYKFKVQIAAPTASGQHKSISGIDIIDDKGIGYKFGYDNKEVATSGSNPQGAPTGFFLEEMSNSIGTDKIQLAYQQVPDFSVTTTYTSTSVGPDNGIALHDQCRWGLNETTPYGKCQSDGSVVYYHTKCLDRITFRGGYIQFNNSSDKRYVESIDIYNATGQKIRSIVFNRSNFSNSERTALNYIDIKNGDNTQAQRYSFEYDLSVSLADSECLEDAWGYCKGSGNSALSCPYRTITWVYNQGGSPPLYTNISIGNMNNAPDENFTKRFVLKKITYPTGGSSEFVFSGNRYMDIDGLSYGGGLRISQIINQDNTGNSQKKVYEYDPGFIEYSLKSESNIVTTSFFTNVPCSETDDVTPIWYQFRDRVYAYGWNSNLGDNRVYYRKITEFAGDLNTNIGKNIYTYTYENQNSSGVAAWGYIKGNYIPPAYIREYRNWGNGLLYKTETYKKGASNEMVKTKSSTNSYEFIDGARFNNLYTSVFCTYPYGGHSPTALFQQRKDITTGSSYTLGDLSWPSLVYNYDIVTGAYYMKSKVDSLYTDDGVLVQTTEYKHENPAHYYVTEARTAKSNGSVNTVRYKYPQDLSSDPVSASMIQANIISPIIETKVYDKKNDNEILKATTYMQYQNFDGQLLPGQLKSAVLSNPLVDRLQFNLYDKYGSILQQQKAKDVKEVYLWGYKSQYPVVKVVGSNYTTVIDKIADLQFKIDAATDISNNDEGVRSLLDGLRTAFGGDSKVQVSTYTYAPLIGMTSETDPAGRTIYYEYDDFGRLKVVKDDQGNIVKKICYSYAGQVIDCNTGMPVNTSPSWTATGNLRCVKDASNANTGEQEREERDNNPYSSTYNQLHWVTNGTNTTSCPLSCPNCTGEGKKCINAACQTGIKEFTSSVYNNSTHKYTCTYHYVWSDESISKDYTITQSSACPL